MRYNGGVTIGLISTEERRKVLLLEHCYACRVRLADGNPWDGVLAQHEDCHGWQHCECCGDCPTCCVNPDIDDALESWESTLDPAPKG